MHRNSNTIRSDFWWWTGFAFSTIYPILAVCGAVTLNTMHSFLCNLTFPYAMQFYLVSFCCQPKRGQPDHYPNFIIKLRFQSVVTWYVAEGALSVMQFHLGNAVWGWLHLMYIFALTVLFHYRAKLRAALGQLDDKDIQKFLVNTLFSGGTTVLMFNLFLGFRVSKCLFENNGEHGECKNKSLCAVAISVFLSALWAMKMVDSSVPSEWRQELSLSIQKIATLKGISFRRGG